MNSQKRTALALLLLAVLMVILVWCVRRRGYLLPGRVTVAVDTRIAPVRRTIPGFDHAPPRPLAALSDGKGAPVYFVENELILATDDEAALNAFARRWGGSVVRHVYPAKARIKLPAHHLVRIDPARANANQLVSDLKTLNPGRTGQLVISSDAGRALLAIATREAVSGQNVGVNFVLRANGYRDKNMTDGMPPAGGYPEMGEPFNRNPASWSYFVRGPGTQNIGVADAWRALDQLGRLNNKVTVAVIDGGFLKNDDNPSDWTNYTNSFSLADANGPNENDCTGGVSCPWHGTNVMGALMGTPNNNYGAAGPAGPVARAISIRRSDDIFNNLTIYVYAAEVGARVVNMSYGDSVPFLLSWTLLPFEAFTRGMRTAGILLVASSGNDGNDVDAEDCAWPFDWPCWERAWYTPCENAGVLCVGSLKARSDQKLESSNYGGDVDLFGPGSLWVGPDDCTREVHSFSGTSAAAPFVAGVAALVIAADPSLNASDVERVLIETANPSSDGLVRRYVNAYSAVIRAIGGTPPDITIGVETAAEFGSCRSQYHFTATVNDPDNGPPAVKWTSSIDNQIGVGLDFTRPLSNGNHRITATATDGIGLSTQSNELTITAAAAAAPRPTISIISLANHQVFAANQDVTLEAGGLDPNKPLGGLVSTNVRWVSSKDGELGWGQRLSKQLSPGSHFIFVYYTGICGNTADDMRLIQVTAAVKDAPPNMHITTPSDNDLVVRTDNTGQACLHVAGFGFDEEDQDFATIEGWETNRKDLQWKVLSFQQNTTVCLKPVPGAASTEHQIVLIGVDRTGHFGRSSPLVVTVLPGIN